MKIISGFYKGRKIYGYSIDGTRPTQDRVKESLFGMIQSRLKDQIVLDLFAGTGSLGFEALSNGSMACVFVDSNPKCIENIKKTIDSFQIVNAEVYTMDYQQALDFFCRKGKRFDLIFLDPPYRYQNIEELLTELHKKSLVNIGGLVVCEYEEDILKEEYPYFQRIREKHYGSKNISIYQYRQVIQ